MTITGDQSPGVHVGDLSQRVKVEELFATLNGVLRAGDGAFGGAWPERLLRFKNAIRLLERIDLGPRSGYIREKLGSAEHWAEILFSARRHQQWDTSAQPGARAIRSFIVGDLTVAESNAFKPAAQRFDQPT